MKREDRLCAYKIHHGMKAGLWVEQPEWRQDRPVKIVLALREAFEQGHSLLLEFEPWPDSSSPAPVEDRGGIEDPTGSGGAGLAFLGMT